MRLIPAADLRTRIRLIAAGALALALTTAASAQTWDGGLSHGNATANNNWTTPFNWVGGTAPASNANTAITFTLSGTRTTANQNIANPFILNSITIDSNNTNFTAISGQALDFHSNSSSSFPFFEQDSAIPVTISNNINLTNSLTIGGSGAGILTFSGALTGAGSLTTAATTAVLTGNGTNLPVVTASAGSLTFTGGTATFTSSSLPFNVGLGAASATLTLNQGAVVNLPSTDSNAGVTIAGPAGTALIMDGPNTKLTSGSYVVVAFGDGGQGQLTVQNHANLIETTQSLEVGTFNGDNGQVLVQTGGAITTTNVIIGVLPGSAGTVTVTGTGSTLTVSGSTLLSFTNGNGHLVVTNGGTGALNGGVQFGNDPSVLTINGGTVTTPSITASTPASATVQVSDPVGGVALTINPGGATTYSGAITDATGGPGTVVKTGANTLTLSGVLTNTGGYTSSQGQIEFNGAVVQPGPGSLTAAAGATMQYDNNSRIFGGFLYGPGTHIVSSAAFTGTTSAPSATINVAGAGATFKSFTNGGNLSVVAGLQQPTAFTGFTNQGSGSVTIGANTKANLADFQTYGTLTLNPATITENFAQTTLLTNTGTSQLFFNGGSRTFLGTPSTAVFPSNWPDQSLVGQPTFVAGIDLKGKNATVAGGLFVNNGYVEDSSNNFQGTAIVIADFGSLVKGAGYFQNSVQTINGGKFMAGNSPGKATFGQFVLGAGGVNNYVFAIDDATGTAGPSPDASGHVSGWGLVKSIGRSTTPGDFAWAATPNNKLTVAMQTLVNPTTVGTDVPGLMDHFDPNRSYSWPAVEWSGSYTGPADVATLDAATAFDTSGFLNPVAGTFGWSLDSGDHTLSLTYTPSAVPEPGTLLMTGLGLLAARRYRRRRA
jgi:T5SS/PEP-CTERM-associated repeat protein